MPACRSKLSQGLSEKSVITEKPEYGAKIRLTAEFFNKKFAEAYLNGYFPAK